MFSPAFGKIFRPPFDAGAAAAAEPDPLLTNLVAYWKLDESSGNAVDSHSNGLTLTNTGTLGYAAAKINNGISNDASAKYLVRADEALLRCGGSSFTFAAWFYANAGTNMQILSKDGSVAGANRAYTMDQTAGATPGIRFYINGTSIVSRTAAAGAWHLVVGWWDATTQKNSIQVDNGTVATLAGTVTPTDGTASFRIGAREYSGFEGYLNGLVDEVGFWKRVLLEDERTRLYNSGNGLSYPFA